MERDTLALSAPLQRNSPVHGLVKLPPFASSYEIGKNQEKSINETVVSLFLPIDRYNRYQSNRIYRLTTRYRFYRLTTPGLTERESAYLVSSWIRGIIPKVSRVSHTRTRQAKKLCSIAWTPIRCTVCLSILEISEAQLRSVSIIARNHRPYVWTEVLSGTVTGSQVAQARNMTNGTVEKSLKYKDLYGRKNDCFCSLRMQKDLNKNRLTLLINKLCVITSFLFGFRAY